jgi:hypothetical protein
LSRAATIIPFCQPFLKPNISEFSTQDDVRVLKARNDGFPAVTFRIEGCPSRRSLNIFKNFCAPSMEISGNLD